jgi:hypothetical protein
MSQGLHVFWYLTAGGCQSLYPSMVSASSECSKDSSYAGHFANIMHPTACFGSVTPVELGDDHGAGVVIPGCFYQFRPARAQSRWWVFNLHNIGHIDWLHNQEITLIIILHGLWGLADYKIYNYSRTIELRTGWNIISNCSLPSLTQPTFYISSKLGLPDS